MAVTQNTYTGNGTTTSYSFTFPYLDIADVKVSVDGVDVTAFTYSSATSINFNTAPASGTAIRIYRSTSSDQLNKEFYPGSTIRAQDLNDNALQLLYVTQESADIVAAAESAVVDVATAVSTSTSALNAANSAISTANSATTTANSAVTTANDAVTTANSAVTTANTANTTANTALSTANAASAAVSSVVNYTIVAAVANIPSSPANGTRIEVTNSTGIETFSPLTGRPGGFIGSSGLAVRISYTTTGSTWQWISYYPTDPENRYVPSTRTASEIQTGLVELATAAETTTGTDNTRAVHPAGLKVELDKKANLGSPTFTGTPAVPTATVSTNTTQAASTAFVMAQIANDVPSATELVAGRVELATAAETTTGTDNTRAVHPAGLKVELDKKAPTLSPVLTGTPTAPTAATSTNTTQIATTAFVKNQAYAPLSSPALSGTPTAPTATAGDNSTQIATTAFVQSAITRDCKGWVNFNGTGTIAIRASYNVTSITDNGAGDYTVNWTNAVNANGCHLATGTAANASGGSQTIGINPLAAPTTTTLRLLQEGSGGANLDDVYIMAATFG